jgi:crotonobetainyl-CoA:carnitine CoA-transferase CaiB-like acyl-CoA transferase
MLRTPPPHIGADTDAILESLGYTVDQIAVLKSAQII